MEERGFGSIWQFKTSDTVQKTDFQKLARDGHDPNMWTNVAGAVRPHSVNKKTSGSKLVALGPQKQLNYKKGETWSDANFNI